MSNNLITHLTINNESHPIGAEAENVAWDNSKNLKQIIGEEINTDSSIDDKLNSISDEIESISSQSISQQSQLALLENNVQILQQKISNLNSSDITNSIIQQLTKNLLKNIPVRNIKWDTLPPRNLKEILGNLDNMPYSTLRDWLEAKGGNNGGSSSSGPIWKSIATQ